MNVNLFNAEKNIIYNDLYKPKIIDSINNVSKDNHIEMDGSIKLGPLNRGGGITLGNALRRVALGFSLGFAIIGFEIEGVLHEFSKIDGVIEDIIDIGLNLKKIRLDRSYDHASDFISFQVKGPCILTAGMIEKLTGVKIVQSCHEDIICNIVDDTTLNIKLIIASGRGYVLASSALFKHFEGHSNLIFLDALFSPVKKFSFNVEESLVNNNKCENLYLHVETDGSVNFRDVLSFSAKILQDLLSPLLYQHQLTSISPFSEISEISDKEELSGGDYLISSSGVKYNINLFKTIDEMEMPVRAHNAFIRANVTYIGDLVTINNRKLSAMSNLGRKSLEFVATNLARFGLKFEMDIPSWPPSDLGEMRKQYEIRVNAGPKKKKNW